MGAMSASDAAPLPRLGEVFFDVRGSSRSMRLSWYADTGVAVLSIWQGGMCTGTFRLAIDDLPRMVETLQRGPDGQQARRQPPAAGRQAFGDAPLGSTGVTRAMEPLPGGGLPPDYQIAPSAAAHAAPSGYPGDPAGRSGTGQHGMSQPGMSQPGAGERGASQHVSQHSADPYSASQHSASQHSASQDSAGQYGADPRIPDPRVPDPRIPDPRSAAQHGAGQHGSGQHGASHSVSQHSVSQHSVSQHSVSQHSAGQHSAGRHGDPAEFVPATGQYEPAPEHPPATGPYLTGPAHEYPPDLPGPGHEPGPVYPRHAAGQDRYQDVGAGDPYLDDAGRMDYRDAPDPAYYPLGSSAPTGDDPRGRTEADYPAHYGTAVTDDNVPGLPEESFPYDRRPGNRRA
jgi:hypothetical protein